jgi:hypothetical protein
MKNVTPLIPFIVMGIFLAACSGGQKDATKETFSIASLVDETKQAPDSIISALNAQHHNFKVLERRAVPGPFTAPSMKYYSQHAVTLDKLPTINPGPGEYVHVWKVNRYNNHRCNETFPAALHRAP